MIGKEQILERLLQASERNRLPHGLLCVGSDQEPMIDLIKELAKTVFTQNKEELSLAENKLASGSHPDFYMVDTDKKEIKIEQVREFQRWLQVPPNESRRKFGLICKADLLNASAANALLKVLEEPPPHATVFLLTRSSDALLPTIRSRLQLVRFPSSGESESEAMESEASQSFWFDDFHSLLERRSNCTPGEIFSFTERLGKQRETLKTFFYLVEKQLRNEILDAQRTEADTRKQKYLESIFDLAVKIEKQTVKRYGNVPLGLDRLILRWFQI